ncbi:unnamed protein product (macronuclear) [Paramecium tetraurelia]|uniref:UBX domain-containing protein n=1 Tax=Paramecium tetraurelia TaxID=5888 RepID=A0BUB5_PARTE|nr:uncharacterized protein GSPATT00032364001 [Paramecium tetraurelia]CAK62132.1 unnamed protein product [Paramecium tetraurelia]|eukprot:XP_001429530.1 hypothetical protein (macronuclear) [Paramecium tetraurelia strain d4-2]
MQPSDSEENINNFMAITGCQDYQKAQSYIQMAQDKLDNAIQLYFDFEGVQSQGTQQKPQQDQLQQRSNSQETPQGRVQNSNQSMRRQPQDDALIEKYRKYQEEKRAKEGIINKTFRIGAGLVSYFFKNAPNYGNEFLKYLQQQQIQTQIAFQSGNFQEKLKKANEETRPLLVYLHNHQNLLVLQKMSDCKSLVANLNRNYSILGLLNSPQVNEQFPNKPEPPAILIYKLDIVDEVVLMEQISLSLDTNFEVTAQRIKTIRAAFNKEYIYVENLKKEVNSPNQPNLNYYYNNQHPFQYIQQQQQTQVQVQKQKEDQRERDLLIQQQKEAYRFAEQQAMLKKQRDEEQRLQEQTKQIEQQQKEEQRLLKKAQLLSNLPEEPANTQGISILFRFVNATRTRRFNFSDKIQVLFDFVESQEDDCFNDPHAKIDLIQNFPRLSLKDKTESIINEVFVDSEMEQLIVDEQE